MLSRRQAGTGTFLPTEGHVSRLRLSHLSSSGRVGHQHNCRGQSGVHQGLHKPQEEGAKGLAVVGTQVHVGSTPCWLIRAFQIHSPAGGWGWGRRK